MFENLKSKIFNHRFSNSKAKNRLQMVLVQDRSGLSPQDMEVFKKDLIEVINRYFELEHNELEVEWQRNEASTALIINTPVSSRAVKAKRVATA